MYKCERCEKEFKTRFEYERHLRRIYPCKDKNIIETDNVKIINELKNKNEELEKELNKLKKEMEKISNNNANNINNVNNNGNNNTNNVNNGNITINNNNINIIQIVNHGEEDYNKINLDEILKKINKPPEFERVSSVIYYIHCNDEFPEYQNIYVSDLSRGKMKIFKDGQWKNKETKPVIESLYNKIIEHYDETNNKNKEVFTFIKKEANKTYPLGRNYSKRNRNTGVNNSINILYENREKIKTKITKINK